MSEIKYIYNKSTLSYERLEQRFLDKLKRVFSYVIVGGLFAAIFIALTYTVFDSPRKSAETRKLRIDASV